MKHLKEISPGRLLLGLGLALGVHAASAQETDDVYFFSSDRKSVVVAEPVQPALPTQPTFTDPAAGQAGTGFANPQNASSTDGSFSSVYNYYEEDNDDRNRQLRNNRNNWNNRNQFYRNAWGNPMMGGFNPMWGAAPWGMRSTVWTPMGFGRMPMGMMGYDPFMMDPFMNPYFYDPFMRPGFNVSVGFGFGNRFGNAWNRPFWGRNAWGMYDPWGFNNPWNNPWAFNNGWGWNRPQVIIVDNGSIQPRILPSNPRATAPSRTRYNDGRMGNNNRQLPARMQNSRGSNSGSRMGTPSRGSSSQGRYSPSRTSPSRTSPSRTTPTRTSPSRTSPSRSTPSRTSPSRTTPTRSTPSRSGGGSRGRGNN